MFRRTVGDFSFALRSTSITSPYEVGAHIILLCGALHMLQKFQVSYPNHTRAASLHMSRNFRLARRYFICFKKKGKCLLQMA